MRRLLNLTTITLAAYLFTGNALTADAYSSFLVPEILQLDTGKQQDMKNRKMLRRVKAGPAEFIEYSYQDKFTSECLQGREPRTVIIQAASGQRYNHQQTYETLAQVEFPFPGAVVTRSEGVCTHGPAFSGFVYLTDKSAVYRFSWPLTRGQVACGEEYLPAIEIRYAARNRGLLMVREERPDCASYSELPPIASVEYLVVEPGEQLVFRRYTEQTLPADLRTQWGKLQVYRGAVR
ncbi:MAG TPA: hypothetical protein PKD60_07405 [Turneriella sp.]|nr:hypothetical protein [Turneriella sp.]